MRSTVATGIFIHLFFSGRMSGAFESGQKLIIVLIDGVRWNYPQESYIRGFNEIAENGVRSEYVDPVSPSNSWPNWYSIATGRLPENHGIMDNFMYDPRINAIFSTFTRAWDIRFWNQAEPLWITAEEQGLRTAVLWWDGCQFERRGIRVSRCYNRRWYGMWPSLNRDFASEMSRVLDEMSRNELQLAMAYYEAVDGEGHQYGPNSQQRIKATKDIDSILLSLQDEIKSKNLIDKVNLIVVSDHGMADTSSVKYININDKINSWHVTYMINGGANAWILPDSGREDEIYKDLMAANISGLTVYKKEDIPEQYGMKRNKRTMPLFLLADPGYSINQLRNPFKNIPMFIPNTLGSHGYGPDESDDMKTIFYGRGPGLKRGYVGPPIRIVDQYNLYCSLLGIKPLPNDGDLSKIMQFTRE